MQTQRLFDSLTKAEKAVALKIAEGLKYQAIANDLGIRMQSVKNHARSIHQKLGTRNAMEITIAVLQGVR